MWQILSYLRGRGPWRWLLPGLGHIQRGRGSPAEGRLRKAIVQQPNIARNILLSPEFSSFLPRMNESFVESIYTPPGYSIINKGYPINRIQVITNLSNTNAYKGLKSDKNFVNGKTVKYSLLFRQDYEKLFLQ